jgi:hypothetical protein
MPAMGRLGPAALALALLLIASGQASADVVARGVHDGSLSLSANGTPYVAYVRGKSLVVTKHIAPGRWRAEVADTVSVGSQVVAFQIGSTGPVALVLSADNRRLNLLRKRLLGWQSILVNAKLGRNGMLGWPGLTFNRAGLPLVAYTRWNAGNYRSQLLLTSLDAKGRMKTIRVTAEGFPQSYVPPPAKPVIVGGRVHVIESYGYHGTVATLEWFPNKRTWTGLGLDAGYGDFPLGAVFGGIGPDGYLHAAWTESMIPLGDAPVTLVTRGKVSDSIFVLDRALTAGLALTRSGAEVAANEWVSPDDLGPVDDAPSVRLLLYRAVYTDPRTGIPYAALLREPITDG